MGPGSVMVLRQGRPRDGRRLAVNVECLLYYNVRLVQTISAPNSETRLGLGWHWLYGASRLGQFGASGRGGIGVPGPRGHYPIIYKVPWNLL